MWDFSVFSVSCTIKCHDAPSLKLKCAIVHVGLQLVFYKWKNHFSEMKGDVGMSHHEKEGNKKMPIPRQEIIDNPIPTSLFMYHAAVLLCVGTGGAILGHIGTLVNVYR